MLIGDIPPKKHWLTLLTPLLQVCSNSGRRHFFSGESHEKLWYQRNSAYIWLGVWNMTLFFIIFHILGISISNEFHIFQRSWIHQPVIIMYVYFNSSNHMYIYNRVICVYIYIIVYYALSDKWWLDTLQKLELIYMLATVGVVYWTPGTNIFAAFITRAI
jgi:hypothetical protein